MKVILMALTLALGGSALCPVVSCENLSSNVCGVKISATHLGLNSKACDSGFTCTAQGLYTWLGQIDTFDGDVYSCHLPALTESNSERMSTVWPCYARLQKREFVQSTNSTLVYCNSDNDCLLQDGTVTPGSCVCSFLTNDNRGICKPDISSKVFDGYWTACGTSKEITDPIQGYYWYLYMTFYPWTRFETPCGLNVWEIQQYSEYYGLLPSNNWAVTIGVASLAMLT